MSRALSQLSQRQDQLSPTLLMQWGQPQLGFETSRCSGGCCFRIVGGGRFPGLLLALHPPGAALAAYVGKQTSISGLHLIRACLNENWVLQMT
jgi:hypothetical protein